MMLREETFQPSPTQLFSIQMFWFASVKVVSKKAFCTNNEGCGFRE